MTSGSVGVSTSRDNLLLQLLRTPWRVLGMVLIVVFAVEAVVMLSLPLLLPPSVSKPWAAVIDASLLTLICSPALWWILIRPLRRIALDARALSSTVVDNAGDGIVTVDRNGGIQSFNPAASAIFGFAPDAVLGQPLSDLLPDTSLEPTEVGTSVSAVGVRADGERFPAAVSVRLLGVDEPKGFVVVIRDLTETRRAEEERTAAAREKEALRAQQMATLAQLATGVAHEIRNPLTAIKMLVQTTRDGDDSTVLEGEDLKIVEDQIRRMEQSVNSLLDFARPAAPEWQSVDLVSLLPDVIRLLSGQASRQGVEIRVVDGCSQTCVDADASQIQQLLLNLGLNALHAMPGGGTLTFHVTNHEPGRICVEVIDTGTGIEPDRIDEIFRPFVTTRKQGIGLGLNICRRIAEQHGGTLTARNHHAGGAVFELCLHVAQQDPVAADCGKEQ